MLKLTRALAIACVAMLTPQAVSAQSAYPDKPIHFIVAFVPGGATDTFARQISNDLQEALGQPIVIENRPGAGGYLAWNHVASSDPDGYTLLLAENAVAISQALYKKSKSPFDPITQYDVDQRSKLNELSTHKAPARSDVVEELINERLKIQLLRRFNI